MINLMLSDGFFVAGLKRDNLSMFLTFSVTSSSRVVGYVLYFSWLYIF